MSFNSPEESSLQPPEVVLHKVQEREAARAARNWTEADRLRSEIAGLGWQVLDTREGPHLEPG